jgi:protein involved in polysaccharide export with SLBB domain
MLTRSIYLFVLLALSMPAGTARAQSDWDPAAVHVKRVQLEDLLQRLEQTAESRAYSSELRSRARHEATLLRHRLEQGDFQVGDRIELKVEGQEQLSGTFAVSPGRVLVLPVIGQFPMQGLLRSELEESMHGFLSRFIRDPVVHARPLIRVAVMGAVGQQGFHVVPAEALLTDVLMGVGGPTSGARLTHIRIERGSDRIWEGEALQNAIIEGRTLDQMSLQAGDRIVVPQASQQRRMTPYEIVRNVAAVASLVVMIERLF